MALACEGCMYAACTREMGADLDVQDLVSLIFLDQIWDMCLAAVARFHILQFP